MTILGTMVEDGGWAVMHSEKVCLMSGLSGPGSSSQDYERSQTRARMDSAFLPPFLFPLRFLNSN